MCLGWCCRRSRSSARRDQKDPLCLLNERPRGVDCRTNEREGGRRERERERGREGRANVLVSGQMGNAKRAFNGQQAGTEGGAPPPLNSSQLEPPLRFLYSSSPWFRILHQNCTCTPYTELRLLSKHLCLNVAKNPTLAPDSRFTCSISSHIEERGGIKFLLDTLSYFLT